METGDKTTLRTSMERAIGDRQVTYDFARLMDGGRVLIFGKDVIRD